MDMNYLFSVLIANYNNGKYIEDAISSIMKQTYNSWEIILVDDCSSDNSKDIYKKYEGLPNIHIYYNDSNHGCGYTKRRCAELANGEICGFLDPDDTLEPDALEVMVKAHEEDKSLSMVYSMSNIVDQDLKFISVSKLQHEIPNGSSFLEEGYCISHFVSFKRIAYKKTPGIDPTFLRAVDHNMYLMLEEVGNVKFVKKELYNYRTNTGSNISLGDNGDKAYIWHITAMIDACRRRNLPIEDIVLNDLNKFIKTKTGGAVRSVLKTKDFRLGNTILKPIRAIKRVFSVLRK